MHGRTTLLAGIVMAVVSFLALGFVPEGNPILLFVVLLGIFFGLCFAIGGAWTWYVARRETPPARVPWRRVPAPVAIALMVTLLLSPWMDRAIIPIEGIGVAAAIGASAMYLSVRHVGHSLLTGGLSACAFVLAMATIWFLGAA